MGLFSKFELLNVPTGGSRFSWAQIKKTKEFAIYNPVTKKVGEDRYIGFEPVECCGSIAFWAVAGENGNYAFMGLDGKLKTEFIFKSFGKNDTLHWEFLPVEMADGTGYTLMDKAFNLIGKRCERVGNIRCGMRAIATQDGETYFKEATGKFMRFHCTKVFDFENKMGMVQTVKGYTYVNLEGKILPIRVAMAAPFEMDGCAIVGDGKNFTLVNKDGVLTEGKFVAISSLEENTKGARNGVVRFRKCYVNDTDYVTAENGFIPVVEWFNLVEKNSENFQYLPYQKFRDSAFVKRCREIVIAKLYKKATETLNEEDITKTQRLLDMLDQKEKTAKEQIRLEDERIAEEARKKAELEQAKLQDKSERQKAIAIAAARRNAEEEKAKREAEEARRRQAEERALAEEGERAKQEGYRAQMFSMLTKTNNKDKAD